MMCKTMIRANDVPAIFLSHSGKQKAFVENLYNALQSANHIAFFHKHTLPKGSPFPSHVFQAVDGCKLGVVVLSDDFLTSKWPMLELERLVQKRDKGSQAIVLPLFYKLQPADLKSDTNLSKWRLVWNDLGGDNADKWEQAVKSLRSFNGEVFDEQATSEAAYIKRVVRLICNLVPSPILYGLAHVQGRQRLAQEVALQFREQCDNVCMVGLYGVGGLGKTTMCTIMCNFYTSHLYPGKCCHIEFPSDGDNRKITQECTKALKQLTNLSDDLLNKAHSFDQVIHLMRENLGRYDLFLAIDNVRESSLGAAKRMLEVSFSANSKILLTSRSEEVLKDLLRAHSNAIVVPLPSLDQQEGFQIFQESFELGDLNSLLENRNLLDSVLKRCFFSGNYHVLALKALGRYVKRACVTRGGLDKIEHILQEIHNNTALQKVEDLIRLNYVNLTVEKKHMFLDIVVVVMTSTGPWRGWRGNVNVRHEKAHQWLSFLYTKYSKSTSMIDNLIYELALDGLIQLDDTSAGKMIRVHDLYFDLAHSEAATSARFFTYRSATSVEEIEWEQLERVILSEGHDDSPHFIEELLQRKCRKLQVLYAENIDFRSGIHLDLMPSLCVLKLEGGTLGSIKDWSASKGLAIVHLSCLKCAPPLTAIPSLPCLEELIIQNVQTVKGSPSLHGGQHHLKKLVLVEASSLFRASYFNSCKASYFNSLTNLESLQITHFNSITRVLNLNALVNLQLLDIGWCKSIKRIEGLHALKNLQRLRVDHCPYLSNLDGLSGLLQIADVRVEGCRALKTMPDLSGLTCLENLALCHNESMDEVGGLMSPALKNVTVSGCAALKTMPDLSGLTCLESLALWNNESMEEVGGENMSFSLHRLSISNCRSLKRFPSLNECVHLRELEAGACFINIIENNILPNLQKLYTS